MSEFKGNVVIVTGASEGIGRALCLALAPHGASLVLAARNAERLESVAAEPAGRRAPRSSSCRAISPTPSSARRWYDATLERFGRLDTLVANAGRTMWARVDEIHDPAVFREVMELNYFSVVWLTLAALPHLKASRGRLVPVASVAGLTGVPSRSGYCASKHALIGFFDSLRIELAGTGVTVTTVCPDFVVSEIHRRALDGEGRAARQEPDAGIEDHDRRSAPR
jgi:NAD(P)-dependent dehydrogenase (short-subunit alcohol dehydrogenase family)